MRIWTIPNLLSFARLLGVPFVVYLGFGESASAVLFIIFVLSGITDYLDGWLARRLNQYSDLGAALDPLADRLYVIAALVVLLHREFLPIGIVLIIVARDLFMFCVIMLMRARGYAQPQVHYIGKAGTMMLLYSIPMLFISDGANVVSVVVHYLALGFVAWGVMTYWFAAALYANQFRQELQRA